MWGLPLAGLHRVPSGAMTNEGDGVPSTLAVVIAVAIMVVVLGISVAVLTR